MNFKSWKDYYLFIRKFAKYSCLNCRYGSREDKTKSDAPESDVKYSHHFCTYWVAMVRWDMQPFVCVHWESDEKEKLPKDDELFTLDGSVLEKLEETDHKWSMDEIKELL